MGGKTPICDRIYEAFKLAAKGRPEVAVQTGVCYAAIQMSMHENHIRKWMEAMEVTDMIDSDGRTIWLVRDHGPRVQRPDEWEIQRQKDLEAQKRYEAEAKARMREIRKAERGRKRAKRGK